MSIVYHIVPPKVEGQYLMPLSYLKEPFPALYQSYASKYVGREELMMQKIPKLNCTWNDVLQFSPVHPEKIKDALLEAGFGWRPMLFFEIDTNKANMNSDNTIIFKHLVRPKGDFILKDDDFTPFSDDTMDQFQQLPQATHLHFKEAKENSSTPFLFIWVPHVLFKGTIPVEKLKIIEVA